MTSSLSKFLSTTRAALLNHAGSTKAAHTIILGNPSADLDSFISAVVYAYFYTVSWQKTVHLRFFIPLLDLPTTSSRHLWRLRPEFGTALRLANNPTPRQSISSDTNSEEEKSLLAQLVTIADIRAASDSAFHSLFSKSSADATINSTSGACTEVVLVDHNAISIPTLSTSDVASRVKVVGCIDHHIDEAFVPSTATPRIIKTGIGSCTSLVVQHLRESGLWELPDDQETLASLSRLALAPILIDTANLTAEGKVSDTDRQAVEFLESCIRSSSNTTISSGQYWNKEAFYDEIATSKANSLDLLTLSEMFERDYKEWTESTSSGEVLNIGISSVVKPLGWLLEKSKGVTNFMNEVHKFTSQSDQKLALFAIMTTSTSAHGEFQRELLILALGNAAKTALEKFICNAGHELKLESWNEKRELKRQLEGEATADQGSCRMWWQRAVGKSRKQVAPLLRDAVKES